MNILFATILIFYGSIITSGIYMSYKELKDDRNQREKKEQRYEKRR